jgi:DNA helicase-2/ATP-dependent DNA helicase PcrA
MDPQTAPNTDAASTSDDPLLADLTPPQLEAVTHVDGPLLVLAGPGSGKTRVITKRIAHLVLRVGIPPWNVLAITFTNKAAGEMRDRVAGMVTERQARALTISTFHSLCARILRQYADRLGLPPGFSIYDTTDQKRAMKQALSDLEINAKNFPPGAMLGTISDAKNRLLDAEAFAEQANDFYGRTVAKVYRKYAQILERNHALDFDDLLLKTVQLLRRDEATLHELRERFQYILVDEYQDTNHAQFLIANALAAGHKNICVTGDPDQSIYGWRGADIQNILDFESHYPEAKTVRLEENYRSTGHILHAADTLIQQNTARKHKSLFTNQSQGQAIQIITCRDERHEAQQVLDWLHQLHDEQDVAWGEMAIFYRTNSLSRVLEEALRQAGVPYQMARGTAFYDRKEIKDAIAYLRAIANPADEVNILRIINTPARGISDKTVKALQAAALADNKPIDRIIAEPMNVTALQSRAQSAVAKFNRLLDGWRHAAGMDETGAPLPEDTGLSLSALVERVLDESGLKDYYANDKSDPEQERLANLGELVSSAHQFDEEYAMQRELDGESGATTAETLLAFLERVSLVADVDTVDDQQGAITLMTLHAAKGLEFKAVVMVGVEDGLLPHDRSQDSEHQIEEERRLCFVGMTRAMAHLMLTHAKYRTIFGQTMPTVPSRFFNELPEAPLECSDYSEDADAFTAGSAIGSAQRGLARQTADSFAPGTRVRHPSFGAGKILDVATMGAHTRARVLFDNAGEKTLVLQYAQLEKIA